VKAHLRRAPPSFNTLQRGTPRRVSHSANSAARQAHRACQPCANCPSCQCVAVKRACGVGQITSIFSPIPPPQEGRIAIVTDVGSGMRWTQRFTRRVSLLADGKDVWSWRSEAGAKVAGSVLQTTVATKRWSPGRARYKPQTIAQGMPVDLAEPVVTAACFFCCRRAMGEVITRHSLRPLRFPRAKLFAALGREYVAGLRACASSGVDIARSERSETIQRRAPSSGLSAGLLGLRSQ
jgi:hypothetical protein